MRRTTKPAYWLGLALGVVWMGLPSAANARAVGETYGRPPLLFEANQGQTDPQVRFLSRGDGYHLFLTPTDAVVSLVTPGVASRAVHLRWVGANPIARITGEEEQPSRVSYLKGADPSRWQRNVPVFRRVRFAGLYPGVDLVYYGNQRQLEHDLVLGPGADPGKLRLEVDGAERLEIDPAGDLVLHLGDGEIRLKKPVSYQEIEGTRREIASAWRRNRDGRLGFEVGSYDPAKPLVIDPVIGFSTYLGGMYPEQARAVAVDSAGNAYVTGETASPDFPKNPSDPGPVNSDAFVVKLDPSGALVYTSFVGGSWPEGGYGIAVDAAGGLYLAGWTFSPDFPQLPPLQPAGASVRPDAFVVKLEADGSTLRYSTTLGGTNRDFAMGIGIDAQNNAYVVGRTESVEFPALHPLSPFHGGQYDLFLAKLNADGSRLDYFTYLGGSDWEDQPAIAVDPQGHAYVTGYTYSADFPTVHSISPFVPNLLYHAFATKFDLSGGSYVYSTILGGSSGEMGFGIAADEEGSAYVTGFTLSPDFPRLGGLQPYRGMGDLFVTKLSASGSLVFSTFFGGTSGEEGHGIAVDRHHNIYLTGMTSSLDFPLKDAFQSECLPVLPENRCGQNAFVVKLSSDGTKLIFSSYLGGTSPPISTSEEYGLGIAADSRGGAYVTGWTTAADFPTVNAIQPAHGGGLSDGFVTRIVENQAPDCSAAFANPATLWPPNGRLVPVSIRNVTDPEGDALTVTITEARQDEPLTKPGIPDASGIGTPVVRVRAHRAGSGDGRVYRLSFEARDPSGASCTGSVTVCVPHDQRPSVCGDGGPLFNSAGS